MSTIERSIEIDAPASTVYGVWTRFEEFPEFMEGVEEVKQVDDRHLHWRASVFGKREEWDAEITEQVPDKRIAWTSTGGATNAGAVTFHRLSDDRSKVMLQLEVEPTTLSEKIADALGVLTRRVEGDLERFKEFVERKPPDDVEGWRGEIPAKPDAAQRHAEARAKAKGKRS
jgi:uncharacterized membrane protein